MKPMTNSEAPPRDAGGARRLPRRLAPSARGAAVAAIAAAVALVSLAGLACRSSASAPAGAEAVPYKIEVTPAPLKVKVGATGAVVIHFTPNKGHHWNEEYPAKVTFAAPAAPAAAKATPAKEQYSKAAGDFAVKDGAAALTVRLTGKQAGAQQLVAQARFSVCNDTTCLIEKKDIAVSVDVAP